MFQTVSRSIGGVVTTYAAQRTLVLHNIDTLSPLTSAFELQQGLLSGTGGGAGGIFLHRKYRIAWFCRKPKSIVFC